MTKDNYQYETEDDLYTIYSVNVTVTDINVPTTNNERSNTFKFKKKEDALSFIKDLWNDIYPNYNNKFFKNCLVVRTNLMRSGKLIG